MLTLLYFARLREGLGIEREEIELPSHIGTVAELTGWLGERGPDWKEELDLYGRVRCAVNQEIVKPEAPVHDGDEVAFFPPVTGG